MKEGIVLDGKQQVLDTDKDSRLFVAPRSTGKDAGAWQRGRDLYYHKTRKGKGIYYVHTWSNRSGEAEFIQILPERQATRFLGERGLECQGIPGSRAYSTLRNWGYGMLEEF